MDELNDVDDDPLDDLLLVSSTRVLGSISSSGGWVGVPLGDENNNNNNNNTRVSNCDALVGWRRMTPQHHQK